jgi:hypothetical protein
MRDETETAGKIRKFYVRKVFEAKEYLDAEELAQEFAIERKLF